MRRKDYLKETETLAKLIRRTLKEMSNETEASKRYSMILGMEDALYEMRTLLVDYTFKKQEK
jgi:hypothetical protein